MSIASIYILDKKGNILINRNYRGEPDPEAVEKFQKLFLGQKEGAISPFLIDEEGGVVYTYHQHANLICLVKSS